VSLNLLKESGGYDEYFRIWGFEDGELASRLNQQGLTSVWLDEKTNPVYHQWHPAGNIHPFMQWWWDDMAIYASTERPAAPNGWGQLVSSEQRPLNLGGEVINFNCPFRMNQYERRVCIHQILSLIRAHPGKIIAIELNKTSERSGMRHTIPAKVNTAMTGGMNKMLSLMGYGYHLQLSESGKQKAANVMLYFFYQLIFKMELLEDYSIDDTEDLYRFRIVPKR
jgi:hypothetical protein